MPSLLTPKSAFANLVRPVGTGAGVIVEERTDLRLATVMARKGQAGALRARIRELYGVGLPDGPRRATAGDITFVGLGRDHWLGLARNGGHDWAGDLGRHLDGIGSSIDQSDGYAVLRIAGPSVRCALAKGLAVDLHPRAFGPGDAAVTSIAHIGVTLWQIDDAPSYEIALFRSLAGSFWHWLSASAGEFGLVAGPMAVGTSERL